MKFRHALLLLLSLLPLHLFAAAQAQPVRVLIVDGFSNHDWRLTTALIRGILEPTKLFDVTVSTAPAKKDSPGWDEWRPKFSDFDVVLQNCNDIGGGPPWPRTVQEDFEKFVANGGGVYVWHSGNNAFPDWPAYNEMIGLGWRKKDFGVAIAIDEHEQLVRIPAGEGRDTGHGARIDTVVKRLGEHAIHAGLPRAWKTPDIEVYYHARGPAKNLEVLSYGFDPRTEMNWPLEWVVTYGKGRVYTSTFGHVWIGDTQPERMRCAGVQTVVVRALQWLARREVTFPVPADFPKADAVSVRAEIPAPSAPTLASASVPAPAPAPGDAARFREPPFSNNVRLADVRMRDACVLADPTTQTYTIIASAFRGVRAYTSKDLKTWEGPHTIFRTPDNFWPGVEMRGIWAPELHRYKDKFYLFLTFDTATKFSEQWRNWLPRVRRASQILVGDSPLGPYTPFENRPALPEDMMTLDGTLWVEDGVPYMVYCHEWVQIVNGTVEMIQLKDDLSATVGEPKRLFFGNDAPWSKRSDEFGCWVTDGPYLYTSKSGKLFMIWSSGSATGYATGVAISDSGKLAGPWRQQAAPLFAEDGGHGMIFRRFDGQLMLVLHQPNKATERARLFELEDKGETLRIVRPFSAE